MRNLLVTGFSVLSLKPNNIKLKFDLCFAYFFEETFTHLNAKCQLFVFDFMFKKHKEEAAFLVSEIMC